MNVKILEHIPGKRLVLKGRESIVNYVFCAIGLLISLASIIYRITEEPEDFPLSTAVGISLFFFFCLAVPFYCLIRQGKWQVSIDTANGIVSTHKKEDLIISISAIHNVWMTYEEIRGRGGSIHQSCIFVEADLPGVENPGAIAKDTACAFDWMENSWYDEESQMWHKINNELINMGLQKPDSAEENASTEGDES
ncbi:MAG: hypothetical protein ACYTFY_11110 [Planctomycetota bacterium]|jgi:hypothetical protein